MDPYILLFKEISLKDIASVGGKNASLGELNQTLSQAGILVPEGFALTAAAYRAFLQYNGLEPKLRAQLQMLDTIGMDNLPAIGSACRALIKESIFPPTIEDALLPALKVLLDSESTAPVAVRSSATAEDLPDASFAGQHDSFLNIRGIKAIVEAVHHCYVSLFNDRAIKYRVDNGFDHLSVQLSVGIQRMVRSDKGAAGVAFTIDPENGHQQLIYLTGAWGLGEAVVQGVVNPDEYYFFKPALKEGRRPMIYHRAGAKEHMMIFGEGAGGAAPVTLVPTPDNLRGQLTLNTEEALQLARWCALIETHYGRAMDIEWAKDGINGKLYILQARPETAMRKTVTTTLRTYVVHTDSPPICSGKAVGKSVVSGRVCIVNSLADSGKVQVGDIIVADSTNPDWNALLRKAVSIVTNKGGRTSHASIVARELGIPAVVGTLDATSKLKDGDVITVSCAAGDSGYVYAGKIDWEEQETNLDDKTLTRTKPMFILADPDKALALSRYPNEGVGLLRMEFIISNQIQVHPMALVQYDLLPESADKKLIAGLCVGYSDKRRYFVDKLSESIALVAAAFYPKDVIIRMSDFKTNEYAQLIGGKYFEPEEENPMLGFRGASRYYNPRYKDAFGLECAAVKVVREDMKLTNVKVMIPFCRTVAEGKKVLEVMQSFGLEKGKDGLEVYVMAEIPSNVILADQFADIFDGFSIGSNDLTQLTLGLDRDSAIVSDLFDENDEAVKQLLAQVIRVAKSKGRRIGLCGQAPSDFPDFSKFLVEQGIDSISFNADALVRGIENIRQAELHGN